MMNRAAYLSIAVVSLTVAACGPAKWQETRSRHTGDAVAETQTTGWQKADFAPGEEVYVNPERLKAVEFPTQAPEESTTVLEKGDAVKVVDNQPSNDDGLVKVQAQADPTKTIYVPAAYLSKTLVTKDRYFVIENIATERLRVYERCTTGLHCANRLVFETEMVAGEDTPDHSRRSLVGTFVIDSWNKFYEDQAHLYPSWTALNAPALPAVGATLEAWVSEALLPAGYAKVGTRGAFGWFTAKTRPNANEQWTHGTWGHGADSDKFIKAIKFQNDERVSSHGCTRVENQAIALMHEMLPAGTKVVKIYARETLARKTAYVADSTAWEWILTSEGAGKKGGPMSAVSANLKNVTVLERGSYRPKQYPTAFSGNKYKLSEGEFRGSFLVDEGRLDGYEDPKSLVKGGYPDKGALPNAVRMVQTQKNRTI